MQQTAVDILRPALQPALEGEVIIWEPHPGKQTEVLQYRVYELLYGGARGGGKTDAGITWLLLDDYHLNPKYRALVIRKNFTDLMDWVDRAERIYTAFGAKRIGHNFVFPSGAKIITGHLKDKNAFEKYQGHEYQRMLIEELTHIPREGDYEKLLGSCRSTVDGLIAQLFATTNPTGKGHTWVKKRFVEVDGRSMAGIVWIPKETGRPRLFLPATVEDNPTLMAKDPGYIQYLDGLPAELRKAWREGSWDVGAGQFFDEWSEKIHVCSPFAIPDTWTKFISLDYGYGAFSAVYWHAIVPGTGKVYTYRELYVTKHTYLMLARAIANMTPIDETIDWIVADNSIGSPNNETGKSGQQIMLEYFESIEWDVPVLLVTKGDGSRKRGWNLVREYIHPTYDENGKVQVRWQIFNTCKEIIRVWPEQMIDDDDPEDLDTDGEDHAPDSISYAFRSIGEALVQPKKKKKRSNKYGVLTAKELWEKVEAER